MKSKEKKLKKGWEIRKVGFDKWVQFTTKKKAMSEGSKYYPNIDFWIKKIELKSKKKIKIKELPGYRP